jgi:uncharacterized membrane protein
MFVKLTSCHHDIIMPSICIELACCLVLSYEFNLTRKSFWGQSLSTQRFVFSRGDSCRFFWLGHGHAAEFAYHAGKFRAAPGSKCAVDGAEFPNKLMLSCQSTQQLPSVLQQLKRILSASEAIVPGRLSSDWQRCSYEQIASAGTRQLSFCKMHASFVCPPSTRVIVHTKSRALQQLQCRPTAARRTGPARRSRLYTAPTAKFIEAKVPVTIEAPRDLVFELFADLERMPEWSGTLEKVQRVPGEESLSDWTFAWNGVRLSWRARDTDRVEMSRICWGSVDGLVHNGSVDFAVSPFASNQTLLTMCVEYDVTSLPAAVAYVLESKIVTTFVESAIQSDLQRFRQFTLRAQRQRKRALKASEKPSLDSFVQPS